MGPGRVAQGHRGLDMVTRIVAAFLLVIATLFAPPTASAGGRIALVIGNEAYDHASNLPQAPLDSRRVAHTLEALGFDVTAKHDVALTDLARAIVDFGLAMRDADVGFFYYAGHGVQVGDKNYLVPVDAEIRHPGYADAEAYDAEKLMLEMASAQARLNVVVLDACRNNPFVSQWRGSGRAFGERGLETMRAPETKDGGFLLAYATDPGRIAEDSGVYAAALVQQLRLPCVDLPRAFARVSDEVAAKTAGRQRPWLNNGAGEAAFDFHPAGCEARAAKPVSGPTSQTPTGATASPRELVDRRSTFTMGLRPADLPSVIALRGGEELVLIPGGDFAMGSPKQEPGRSRDEGPVHTVTLHGFYVLRTEVTQRLWERVMQDNPSRFAGCGLDCPVESVSWLDAVRFANRLSELEGVPQAYTVAGDDVTWDRRSTGYRLLTEAEWEYAARGVTDPADPFAGGRRATKVAWTADNGQGRPHPACGLRANEHGLCDMSGNVWEWVWDRYGPYPARRVQNPVGSPDGPTRVQRGGSWDNLQTSARVAARSNYAPDVAFSRIGFRIGRSVP